MFPFSAIRLSLWLEDEGLEAPDIDRVRLANFSLLPTPVTPRPQEFLGEGRPRDTTIFNVPLFHLDGRRDEQNTILWWPFDIMTSLSTRDELTVSVHRTHQTMRDEMRRHRLFLNGMQNEGADEDFRLLDANEPRLIRLQDHCLFLIDRVGRILDVAENPFEEINLAALQTLSHRARNIASPPPPPPPPPSSIFARYPSSNENDDYDL